MGPRNAAIRGGGAGGARVAAGGGRGWAVGEPAADFDLQVMQIQPILSILGEIGRDAVHALPALRRLGRARCENRTDRKTLQRLINDAIEKIGEQSESAIRQAETEGADDD